MLKSKKELVFSDIEEEMRFRSHNYKQSLAQDSALTFFNTYRDILDMDHFEDRSNTFSFWLSYTL